MVCVFEHHIDVPKMVLGVGVRDERHIINLPFLPLLCRPSKQIYLIVVDKGAIGEPIGFSQSLDCPRCSSGIAGNFPYAAWFSHQVRILNHRKVHEAREGNFEDISLTGIKRALPDDGHSNAHLWQNIFVIYLGVSAIDDEIKWQI